MKSLNVLIGANGVGKSNFINYFRLISEIYNKRLQTYVAKQGGPDVFLHFGRKVTELIKSEIVFYESTPQKNNTYYFELAPTADNKFIFNTEEVKYTAPHSKYPNRTSIGSGHQETLLFESKKCQKFCEYIRGFITQCRVYHFHDTSESAKIKQPHGVNHNIFLEADAANLAAYLRRLKEKYPDYYQRIVSTINLVAPFFRDFVYREYVAEHIELEWFHHHYADTPLKAHLLSDGTLRFICLATLLLQPPELQPDTIIIDEPELGLHPYAITILAEMLKQVSENKQVIVSTQSVELVDEFSADDIIVCDQEEGVSVFKRLDQDKLSNWLQDYSLGDLWKKNILGGRP